MGDQMLVRNSESLLHWDEVAVNHTFEKRTGQWGVEEAPQPVINMVVKLQGRKKRTRSVSVAAVKPFHERPRDLRYPMEDVFAQQARRADLGRPVKPTLIL